MDLYLSSRRVERKMQGLKDGWNTAFKKFKKNTSRQHFHQQEAKWSWQTWQQSLDERNELQ